jgi:zinc transport system substrate-binding protein
MVEAGQSPHTFEPTPKQMATLADADVYFGIGLPFEERIRGGIEELNPELTFVDTSARIPRREVEGAHRHAGEHESHEEHAGHGDNAGLTDPHVWLNPRFAKTLAEETLLALRRLRPESAEFFYDNLAALVANLDELDAELSEVLTPLAGESVYVFHPAFGYFTDAYGLIQVPVEVGGMEPSARELVELTRQAKKEGVRVIFVQPQFASRSAEAIAAEIGGAVVAIDPLSPDYLENLRGIAAEIRRALGDEMPDKTPNAREAH